MVDRPVQQTIKTASLNVTLKLEKLQPKGLKRLKENSHETVASRSHELSAGCFLFFAGSS
jgi:hypothetical protein